MATAKKKQASTPNKAAPYGRNKDGSVRKKPGRKAGSAPAPVPAAAPRRRMRVLTAAVQQFADVSKITAGFSDERKVEIPGQFVHLENAIKHLEDSVDHCVSRLAPYSLISVRREDDPAKAMHESGTDFGRRIEELRWRVDAASNRLNAQIEALQV